MTYMDTDYTYFIIHSSLPQPLAKCHLNSLLNNKKSMRVEGTRIAYSQASDQRNVIGIEHPGLAALFEHYLSALRVSFTKTDNVQGATFKEMSIVDVSGQDSGIFSHLNYLLSGH